MQRIFGLLPVFLLLFIACDADRNAESLMPSVGGKAFEVVLVMEDGYWTGAPGVALKGIMAQEIAALPQPEPKYDLVRIPSASFTTIFQQHRNIIYTKVDDAFTSPKLSVQRNVWAKPQSVIRIEVKDAEALRKVIDENADFIADFFKKAEMERMRTEYRKYEDISIGQTLRDKHNISMVFPKGYTVNVNNSNFVWISHETQFISQGLFVYYYNYIDSSAFTPEYLIDMRESFLKDNVPAFIEGSYMTTDRDFPMVITEYLYNEKYAMELRGLWRLNKGFMGGPFVSISTVDEARNRIVTIEAYVYAPKFEKRNYLNQVEAIINTFEILPKENVTK